MNSSSPVPSEDDELSKPELVCTFSARKWLEWNAAVKRWRNACLGMIAFAASVGIGGCILLAWMVGLRSPAVVTYVCVAPWALYYGIRAVGRHWLRRRTVKSGIDAQANQSINDISWVHLARRGTAVDGSRLLRLETDGRVARIWATDLNTKEYRRWLINTVYPF